MEKNKLKELITEHKKLFLDKKGLIKRSIQDKIGKFLKSKEIIVITGVRRGGKSSLMRLICDDILLNFNVAEQNFLYINFEDERFIDFNYNDFELLYETFLELENPGRKKYFFLDEIQNIKGWEKWTNRLYEFEDIKIFVTGSNAAMLSSEISSALTGRNRQIENYPFSFKEFLALRNYSFTEKDFYSRDRKIELKRLFKEYLRLGGFPEILKTKDPTLSEQYFRDILYRDIISGHSIRNVREIKELCLFIASNIGTIQSYENLKKIIGVKGTSTVKNYLEILENVFLFYMIDLFSYSVKRQIYNPSKIYSIDPALTNSIAFKFSQGLGHIYENIVFLELKRRNKEIYYWKSKKNKEVDFLTKKGRKIEEAIQVSFNISEPKTKEREIAGLIEAKSELKVNNLTIITDDEEGQEKINRSEIKIIPLWKWLLTSNDG